MRSSIDAPAPARSSIPCARTGFSLVELLVVIAITAILAALMLSGVNLVRSMAKSSTCSSNLRQILFASQLYSADNLDYQVPAYQKGDVGPVVRTTIGPLTNIHWGWLIRVYLGYDSPNILDMTGLKVLSCPETPQRFGYGHNMAANGIWSNALVAYQVYVHIAEIMRPSMKVYYADYSYTSIGVANNGGIDPRSWSAWHPYLRPGDQVGSDFSVYFVHRRRANIAWVDGHVSSMDSSEDLIRPGDANCRLNYWGRP